MIAHNLLIENSPISKPSHLYACVNGIFQRWTFSWLAASKINWEWYCSGVVVAAAAAVKCCVCFALFVFFMLCMRNRQNVCMLSSLLHYFCAYVIMFCTVCTCPVRERAQACVRVRARARTHTLACLLACLWSLACSWLCALFSLTFCILAVVKCQRCRSYQPAKSWESGDSFLKTFVYNIILFQLVLKCTSNESHRYLKLISKKAATPTRIRDQQTHNLFTYG